MRIQHFILLCVGMVSVQGYAAKKWALEFCPTTSFAQKLLDESEDLNERFEEQVVRIISEPQDNLLHIFSAEVNAAGELTALIRRAEGVQDETRLVVEEFFDRYATLARASDRDVLQLRCNNCTVTDGGELVLKYLKNGILNTYKEFKMRLHRDENENFTLSTTETLTLDGAVVAPSVAIWGMKLVSNFVFGQIVGIARIDINEDSGVEPPVAQAPVQEK